MQKNIIIKNGKIFTCENNLIIENGFIIIENGLIKAVDDMKNYNADENDSNVINADGLVITPGFIDAHCHIGICEDSLGYEGEDANEETDPITPQIRAIDAINPFDRAFKEARDSGVTTACVAPGSANAIAGQICVLKTAGKRVDNMVINPFLAMKMAFGENPKSIYGTKNQSPNTRMATAALVREELFKAQRYKQDMEKAEEDEDESFPDFDAKLDALLPLIEKKVPAHIHAHRADDIFTAIRIAKEFDLDYVIVHCTDASIIAQELASENVKICLGPIIGGRTKPELYNHSVKSSGILHLNGLKVAINTDHPEVPIDMLALSAAICYHNGLPYNEALNSITCNASKLLKLDDKIGSLKSGKDGDILIFDGDPISGFNTPKTVIIDGKIIKE